MTAAALLAVACVAAAVWVAFDEPRHQLRRLGHTPPRVQARVAALLRGREGALALPVRALLGAMAAGAIAVLLPTHSGMVVGALALPVIVVGGGQVVRGGSGPGTAAKELADTVELLAVCLAAGTSVRHALDVVADVSGTDAAAALARVSGQLAVGVPEAQAWLELAGDEAWGTVAKDIARSSRSGTSLVEVLHVQAQEARLTAREHAVRRARTAGVRSVVPLVACFLPAFVLVGVVPIIAGLLGGLLSP